MSAPRARPTRPPTLHRPGSAAAAPAANGALANPFAPAPAAAPPKTLRASTRNSPGLNSSAAGGAGPAASSMVLDSSAFTDGGPPEPAGRQRSASHYARQAFGQEDDPEDELRRRLARIEAKKKSDADAAAEKARQDEEKERNSGLFGWIGAAVNKPAATEPKRLTAVENSSSDEEEQPDRGPSSMRKPLVPPAGRQQSSTQSQQQHQQHQQQPPSPGSPPQLGASEMMLMNNRKIDSSDEEGEGDEQEEDDEDGEDEQAEDGASQSSSGFDAGPQDDDHDHDDGDGGRSRTTSESSDGQGHHEMLRLGPGHGIGALSVTAGGAAAAAAALKQHQRGRSRSASESESGSGSDSGSGSNSGSDDASSSSSSSSSDSGAEDDVKENPAPLSDVLHKKEVLALPTVEATLRTMTRGAYFTLHYVTDVPGARAVNLSVQSHRRISTIDMQKSAAMAAGGGGGADGGGRRGRGGGGGGDDDEDDDPYASSGFKSGVNPFFIPQPHTKPTLARDIFMWLEAPGALTAGTKYPPDTLCSTNRDAKGKIIKNQRLSGVSGGPHEHYKITADNYLSYLEGASLYWCEAHKLPLAPKADNPDVDHWDGTGDNPFPTHMPHPRQARDLYIRYLSHPHQQRIKKEDQKMSVLDLIDLYTGKKSFAFMSTTLQGLNADQAFTIATKDASLSLATDNAHIYNLIPYAKPLSARRQAKLVSLDMAGLQREQDKAKAKSDRRQLIRSIAQRDAWLLGFASLLSVGRNLVKHRIERGVAIGGVVSDKALKTARHKNRRRIKAFASLPKTKGPLLVRDAASCVRTGVFAKRYYVESHTTNEIADAAQSKTVAVGRHRAASHWGAPQPLRDRSGSFSPMIVEEDASLGLDAPPGASGQSPKAQPSLDSVRRVLHYEEVFVFAEFPNDPDVKDLPESGGAGLALGGGSSGAGDDGTPMVRVGGGGLRAARGGMSDQDEELDMYGAAFYWCRPDDSASRPRNPTQSIFFSQLEDVYVGKKTEAFVFDHIEAGLCLSLYTPTQVLDLQFESEASRNLWVKSIVALLQLHRIIGADRKKDAQTNQLALPSLSPPRPTSERKASLAGLTPLWLQARSANRNSLYGSLPLFQGTADASGQPLHTRSPSFGGLSPLALPATAPMLGRQPSLLGLNASPESDASSRSPQSPAVVHHRKISDLDLMGSPSMKAQPHAMAIAEEEDGDEDA